MTKIVAMYGSPRRKGNTSLLLKKAVQGAREVGAEVEEIVLRDLKISPCLEIYRRGSSLLLTLAAYYCKNQLCPDH